MQNRRLTIDAVDASRKLDENDREIAQIIAGKKVVVLLNKSDLEPVLTREELRTFLEDEFPVIEVSAKEERDPGAGTAVKDDVLKSGDLSFNDEVMITNMRQKSALQDAYMSLRKVQESIEDQMPEDFYSIDLMDAYEALGSITGETIGEDFDEIFSKFCMGK